MVNYKTKLKLDFLRTFVTSKFSKMEKSTILSPTASCSADCFNYFVNHVNFKFQLTTPQIIKGQNCNDMKLANLGLWVIRHEREKCKI